MTTVTLLQIASPDSETPAERRDRVAGLLREHRGSDLYALPELWSAGYFNFDAYEARAETLDGPTVTAMRELARELRAHIHLGSFIERSPEGKLFNTAVLVDDSGDIAHTYRKVHVLGYDSLEAQLLTRGDTLDVATTGLGVFGSTTCYDLRFPGLWQELSNRGAEVILVPAAWPAVRREHWRVLTQARAIEHQAWIIACNGVGTQNGVTLGGSSRIIDPRGQILVECSTDSEQVITRDIDLTAAAAYRDEFPIFADRLVRYTDLGRS